MPPLVLSPLGGWSSSLAPLHVRTRSAEQLASFKYVVGKGSGRSSGSPTARLGPCLTALIVQARDNVAPLAGEAYARGLRRWGGDSD